MPSSVALVDLYPGKVELPRPSQGESYAVFKLKDFSESGVHAFIHLVPTMGVAMGRSKISKEKAVKVGKVAAAIAELLEDGKVDEFDVMMIASLVRKLDV